jgi:hypothetical protein
MSESGRRKVAGEDLVASWAMKGATVSGSAGNASQLVELHHSSNTPKSDR